MNATMKNKVTLIGNLGTDVDVREFSNGNALARFALATNERVKNKEGEYVTETTWHNLVCWGNTAKAAEKILRKGIEVAIEGKLTSRSYEDKDGKKRYVTEVQVAEIVLLGKKEKGN